LLKGSSFSHCVVVLFTSDNGSWLVKKEEGGSAGLLREGKGSTWEGGMREPAIAWWPGTIGGGRTTQAMATTMDVFATALALGGATLPQDREMDGTDLMPVLTGAQRQIRDEVFYYLGAQLFAVRKGSWKMHLKTLTPYVGEAPVEHDPPLLFNLDHDYSWEVLKALSSATRI
jgi:arylsulfatase A